MAVRQLVVLPAGYIENDKGNVTAGLDGGKTIRQSCVMALIRSDDGNILVDTGINPAGRSDPVAAAGAERGKLLRMQLNEEDDVRNRLGALGLLPDDIKYVINTHLHWDHAGGNRFFPRAVFLVQRAEYRYALYPDQFYASLYVQSLFAPDSEAELHYELLEGDREIVKGVSVVMTPGHTPGHQAVVVNLPRSGTIIFAGDAILTWENMEKDLPQGLCRHQALYLESLHRLVHLAGEGGLIVPGHDPALTQRVRVSPEYYD